MGATRMCGGRMGLVWLLLSAATAGAWGSEAQLPVGHFTRRASIDNVTLSPSGKRMAFLAPGAKGLHKLAVMDLDPMSEPRVVAGFADARVISATWVTEDRLVFEAIEDSVEVRSGGAGTYAVDHDGTDERNLIAWRWSISDGGSQIASRVLPYGWAVHSIAGDGSDDVFVYQVMNDSAGDPKQISLGRLNTSTGMLRMLSHGMPEGTHNWVLDARLEPRMVQAYRAGKQYVYWREPGADGKWVEVAAFDAFDAAGFKPWLIDGDGRALVLANGPAGTEAIYRFDEAARRLEPEPVLAVKGFDLSPVGELDSRTKRLLGVHFRVDRPMSYWFDPGLQGIQHGVDAALPPGRSNRLYCGECATSRFIVVRSSSDRQPGEYFLYDRTKRSLSRLGASHPWIDENTQGRRTMHRVAARDGLSLPVYVTHPAGKQADEPLPTVVLVHGGPWQRGSSLDWTSWAQFLASRGYRVLEPEFRGSDGYGHAHLKAGFKEWGRAMQDDLADVVQWAAGQKLADASKVCIMGAGYGGYASLMGPVAHPTTYQCAISYAGITDIELMYSISWSRYTQAARRSSMPVLIGDRERDEQRLDAASPLKRVGEIKVPVLLGHGLLDQWVPHDHAAKFVRAAKRGGVVLEDVNYQEAHGFVDPDNEADFLRRAERLLERTLRP